LKEPRYGNSLCGPALGEPNSGTTVGVHRLCDPLRNPEWGPPLKDKSLGDHPWEAPLRESHLVTHLVGPLLGDMGDYS
jgi:hypothetical protein